MDKHTQDLIELAENMMYEIAGASQADYTGTATAVLVAAAHNTYLIRLADARASGVVPPRSQRTWWQNILDGQTHDALPIAQKGE